MKEKLIQIPIDRVVLVDELYPREGVNWLRVYQFRRVLAVEDTFDPIVVVEDGGVYPLIDGAHRWQARVKEGQKKIHATLLIDLPKARWFEEAVRRNIRSIQPLSTQERASCCDRLRRSGYTWKQIEAVTFIPTTDAKQLIARVFHQVKAGDAAPVGRRGRFYERSPSGLTSRADVILKRPILGLVKGKTAAEVEQIQRHLAARDQLSMIEQLADLAEGGALDLDNAAVVEALQRLRAALARVKFAAVG